MSADILGTSCDQSRSMVQYSFTSTETRRLVRTDSPGRPPRLSHSSWTMSCFVRIYGVLLYRLCVWVSPKLQALVYADILPSTTAVFSYAIGSIKLSANEQFFCWCSNSSMFVTDNSNKTRRAIYSRQQIKPQSFESRRNFFFFFFYPVWMRFMFTCVPWH